MSGGLEEPINGNSYQHLTYEPVEAFKLPEKKDIKRTFVEEDLDERFAKLNDSGDLTRIMVEIIAICALLSAQGKSLTGDTTNPRAASTGIVTRVAGRLLDQAVAEIGHDGSREVCAGTLGSADALRGRW